MTDDGIEYPETVDVLRYETPTGPSYRTVTAGEGGRIVAAHEAEVGRRRRLRWAALAVVVTAVATAGVLADAPALGAVAAGIAVTIWWLEDSGDDDRIPKLVDERVRRERAASTYDVDVHAADPRADGR